LLGLHSGNAPVLKTGGPLCPRGFESYS